MKSSSVTSQVETFRGTTKKGTDYIKGDGTETCTIEKDDRAIVRKRVQ